MYTVKSNERALYTRGSSVVATRILILPPKALI
jgi:hypothetical protein